MSAKTIVGLALLLITIAVIIYEQIRINRLNKKTDQACQKADQVLKQITHKHA